MPCLGRSSPRSDAKAIIALTPVLGLCEETGIEFEWVDVDELKGKPAEKLYSKVHRPAGAPTILHLAQRLESAADDAGKEALVADGVQVFGTNAILRYLADRCREAPLYICINESHEYYMYMYI